MNDEKSCGNSRYVVLWKVLVNGCDACAVCDGVQAVPLPTAILTAQTGYSSFYCEDLTSKMDSFIDEWSKLELPLMVFTQALLQVRSKSIIYFAFKRVSLKEDDVACRSSDGRIMVKSIKCLRVNCLIV